MDCSHTQEHISNCISIQVYISPKATPCSLSALVSTTTLGWSISRGEYEAITFVKKIIIRKLLIEKHKITPTASPQILRGNIWELLLTDTLKNKKCPTLLSKYTKRCFCLCTNVPGLATEGQWVLLGKEWLDDRGQESSACGPCQTEATLTMFHLHLYNVLTTHT